MQILAFDEPHELDRLVGRPGLVRVGAEDEVVAGRRPRALEALGVGLRVAAADLELEAGEPEVAELGDLVLDLGAAVVATDRDHRQLRPEAAPEAPERLAEGLPDRVPQGRVDAGAGDEAEPAVAEDVERRGSRELPVALDGVRVLADQRGRDLLVDDPRDLAERGILVAGPGLADDSLLGVHAADGRRAVRHLVLAAAIRPHERDADRDRLERANRQPAGGVGTAGFRSLSAPARERGCSVAIAVYKC